MPEGSVVKLGALSLFSLNVKLMLTGERFIKEKNTKKPVMYNKKSNHPAFTISSVDFNKRWLLLNNLPECMCMK